MCVCVCVCVCMCDTNVLVSTSYCRVSPYFFNTDGLVC